MTPDEIQKLLAEERKELHGEPLPTEGKGYSFWFGPRNPRETNRILRVSKDSITAPTKVKLAVNERIPVSVRRVVETESMFTGDVAWLLQQVDEEIDSYLKYIAPRE